MTTPTPEDIKAQYGFVALLASAVPEIGALMQQAVNEKWTGDRFRLALANTNWWKTTPAPSREWVSQQYADPASAQRSLQSGGDQVMVLAGKYGFSLTDPGRARELWLNAKLSGYDDRMLELYVFNDLQTYRPGTPQVGGELGMRTFQAKRLAADYGYDSPTLDQEVTDAMARSISMNQDQTEGMAAWQQKLVNNAIAKYAPFAEQIKAGATVQDIAKPYLDVYAQTLELAPGSVGLNDQQVQQWLQGRSETGKPPVAVPVWQAQQELRKDPRWTKTQNARQAAADVLTTIGKSFGMIG